MNLRTSATLTVLTLLPALVLGVSVAGGAEANERLFGGGDSITQSCQSAAAGDISIGFTPTYTPEGFTISDVRLSNLSTECFTQSYQLVVNDKQGVPIATATGEVVTTAQKIPLRSPALVTDVGSVSVVLYDD